MDSQSVLVLWKDKIGFMHVVLGVPAICWVRKEKPKLRPTLLLMLFGIHFYGDNVCPCTQLFTLNLFLPIPMIPPNRKREGERIVALIKFR